MPTTLTCSLITPEQEVFEKEATYVDLPAHDGQMGFQANRAPLLVKLGYGLLTVKSAEGETKMMVGGGFAQMKGDKLAILTDEAKGLDELDAAGADKALAEALALPSGSPTEQERKAREVARARAIKALVG